MNIHIYIGIGSNQGDRRENILQAVEALDAYFGRPHDALSNIIETEPWGFESEDKFLNAVVRYRVDVPRGTCAGGEEERACGREEAYRLLDECKRIEAELGRGGAPRYDKEGRRLYESRPIDLDILLFGDLEMDEERLTIPHPLMQERDFVMIPLRELMGGHH